MKKASSKDILGAKELKYFGDLICTMNGTSLSKAVMKSFEEHWPLRKTSCFSHLVHVLSSNMGKKYHFLANIWGPSLFVILLNLSVMLWIDTQ